MGHRYVVSPKTRTAILFYSEWSRKPLMRKTRSSFMLAVVPVVYLERRLTPATRGRRTALTDEW